MSRTVTVIHLPLQGEDFLSWPGASQSNGVKSRSSIRLLCFILSVCWPKLGGDAGLRNLQDIIRIVASLVLNIWVPVYNPGFIFLRTLFLSKNVNLFSELTFKALPRLISQIY